MRCRILKSWVCHKQIKGFLSGLDLLGEHQEYLRIETCQTSFSKCQAQVVHLSTFTSVLELPSRDTQEDLVDHKDYEWVNASLTIW